MWRNDKGRHKVSKEDESRIYEVRSNPFEIFGTKCVLLKGKQGGYAVDALIEVEEEKEIGGGRYQVGFTREYIRAALPAESFPSGEEPAGRIVKGKLTGFLEPDILRICL